jgi:hypothetical protein
MALYDVQNPVFPALTALNNFVEKRRYKLLTACVACFRRIVLPGDAAMGSGQPGKHDVTPAKKAAAVNNSSIYAQSENAGRRFAGWPCKRFQHEIAQP